MTINLCRPSVASPMTIAAIIAGLMLGCGEDPEPMPSGATCPPSNTLTYDNFAAPFMARYCTRCHSSTLEGPARKGAPLFHDFDTRTGILNVGNHVDTYTAAGPLAVNELMPPDSPSPTLAEREQLGAWLACERAAQNR